MCVRVCVVALHENVWLETDVGNDSNELPLLSFSVTHPGQAAVEAKF